MSAITCIAFAEFLSALYAGDLDGPGLNQLKNYAAAFMTAEYTADRLAVLYECFRHKVAHLALPYAVFDTDTKRNTFRDQPRRLITWMVTADSRNPSVEIIEETPKKRIEAAVTPWPVYYDHQAIVHLPPELLRASGSRPQLRSLTARLAHRKVRASAVY